MTETTCSAARAAMMTLLALTTLTGCERGSTRDIQRERSGAGYREAMEELRAGRVEQACARFEKLVVADPANASARFQLACLLQDGRKDALGAYCAYREFLQQTPAGDKVPLARDRMAACERDLAKILAKKYGLDAVGAVEKTAETLRGEMQVVRERNVKLEDDLAAAMRRIAALRTEKERLVSLLKSDGSEAQEATVKPDTSEAKAVLREDGQVAAKPDASEALAVLREDGQAAAKPSSDVRDAKAILEEDEENPTADRLKLSEDIARLRREGAEEAEGGTSLLPKQAPDARAQRAAAEAARAKAKEEAAKAAQAREPLHERRPDTYVVQEGDTLIRIAIRFYGRATAWHRIREANKAIVSTDGRVQKGMRLKLPQ